MSPLFRTGRGQDATSASRGKAPSAESKLGLLGAAELFRDLSEDEMTQVDRMTVMTRSQKGRIIYAPDQTGEALFILKRGKVHIYRITPDGRKLIMAVIGPGTVFGDMAFTGQSMMDSFAEAIEDATLCVMSRHDVEELVRQYPSVGIRLLDTQARRVRELEARLEESSLRDMQSRVASALLRLWERQGTDTVEVSHQELADIVGTYRETVTRTLAELRDDGLIALERRSIHIANAAGLRSLVASEAG